MPQGATIATAIHCDAITRGQADDFGWHFVPCGVTLGLRTFTDRNGVTRAYCPSAEHKRNVERRFGVGEACVICGKATDDTAITVNLGLERLGLMCGPCCDDLEPLTAYDDEDRDDGREGQPEFNGAFGG